jgi:hypothetical protein
MCGNSRPCVLVKLRLHVHPNGSPQSLIALMHTHQLMFLPLSPLLSPSCVGVSRQQTPGAGTCGNLDKAAIPKAVKYDLEVSSRMVPCLVASGLAMSCLG